ncbi:hypothetical protein TREES_T100008901 [Tupaia chinensis]|uniref:Uncharacterized protein n=1 Tax=Tupaia chinensis TaxID=246437 RepID=L9L5J8_TUPCH|nr:hypothetical protein TREES_T100008901 [Tupaia chinensis]
MDGFISSKSEVRLWDKACCCFCAPRGQHSHSISLNQVRELFTQIRQMKRLLLHDGLCSSTAAEPDDVIQRQYDD